MEPQTVIIWNRGSNRGQEQPLLDEVRAAFTHCVQPHNGGEFEQAVHAACEEKLDEIWIAGGDGTVHAAANALMAHEHRPPLGILPTGTGNDFCRSLGLPLDPLECLQHRNEWQPGAVDLISAEHEDGRQYVVNAAGGGVSGMTSAAASRETKERWGALAYARAALDAVASSEAAFTTLSIDDEALISMPVYGIILANGKTMGHGYSIAADASVRDGLLDLLIIHDSSLLDLALLASHLVAGSLADAEKVVHHKAHTARIHGDVPFSFDGDPSPARNVSFQIVPSALVVLAPAEGHT